MTIEELLAQYRLQVAAQRKTLNGVRCAGGIITSKDVQVLEGQVFVSKKHLILKTILGLTDTILDKAGIQRGWMREAGYLWMRWAAAAEGQEGAWPTRAQKMLQVRAALSSWWLSLLQSGTGDWLAPLASSGELAAAYATFQEVMGRTGGSYQLSAGLGFADNYGTDFPMGYIGDIGAEKIRNQQLREALEPLAGLAVFVESENSGYGQFGSTFWFAPRVKLRLNLAESRGNPEGLIISEWYDWVAGKYGSATGRAIAQPDWHVVSTQIVDSPSETNYPPTTINTWEISVPITAQTGAWHYAPVEGGDGAAVPTERMPWPEEVIFGAGWENELLALDVLMPHRWRSETFAGWFATEDARERGWWDGLLLSPTRDDFSAVQEANDFAPTVGDVVVACWVVKMLQLWHFFGLTFRGRS